MGFLNNELNHKQQSGDFVKMIKQFFLAMMVCIVSLSQTGCGLSIVQDWQASGGKAITGGGAIAGKDYVSGLKPSENARKYFAKISANGDSPIETVRRTDDSPSKTGVRFVKNGGILIPPGVTISFTNRGYCMDPHLPAPKAGEEFQLVPVTQLIPEDLQGIYKKLVTKASSGDPSVQRNMQHLIWALRTAGTDAAFANNLTPQQKRILDRCSEYPGQFEEFNANAKANSKALKELIGLADSFLNVKIGNVSYKASDLLDPDVGNKKINEHLNQLIGMSQHLPVEKSDFNFGEIQPGIYTDILGTDYLQYRAKIANTTNKSFIYYPSEYVGQVGSSAKNSGLAFYAAIDTTMRQRVTGENPDDVDVENEEKTKEKCTCIEIAKMKSKIQEKHAWRYKTVVACLTVQNAVYNCPGIGGAVKFFYKSLHGDYNSYKEAGKDAFGALTGAYLNELKTIDFNLMGGNSIGYISTAIDSSVSLKGAALDSIEMIRELKKNFSKIDRIIQREINGLPKCPVHSK